MRLTLRLILPCTLLFLVFSALADESTSALETAPVSDQVLDGIAAEELQRLTKGSEKHEFEAQVDKMMRLIINSLYRNKEIFLRELISNASDALDKIRLISVKEPKALDSGEKMLIQVRADDEKKQLIIRDTGVGMTKEELLRNLGTIAKSGTADFMKKFEEAQTAQETTDLIGQFGVGFYSSFLVADKVTVISKHNDDAQYIWESDSKSFSLSKDPRGDTLGRGTEIILHLKDEAQDFLKPKTLREITERYSQFITFPIYLWESETKMVDVEEDDEAEKKEEEDAKKEDDDVSVEEKPEDEKKEKKQVEKTFWAWNHVNSQKPIWKRAPSDVTEQEYEEFYKHVTDKSYEKPLSQIHFKAEGDVNFNSIIYIPEQVFGDMFGSDEAGRERALVKLFVRRVFITDELKGLIPRYLAFIRGVIDSEDLPLNVSRETLQQNKLMRLIRKKVIRKVIEMIQKMDEEKFAKFWGKFSVNMKLGLLEDQANKDRLSKLLRFATSRNETGLISLTDYVERMKKGQTKIFYVTAPNIKEAKLSPFVERALRMGYEVVYMVDPMDEHMVGALTEFDGKPLQNLAKAGVELQESEESKASFEALKTEFQPLLDWLLKEPLKEKIARADISNRLTETPAALVAPEYGWSGNMERMMTAQAYKASNDPSMQFQANMKRYLDLNPRHPIIKEMKMLVAQDPNDQRAHDIAVMLFDLAALRSGYAIQNPTDLARRIEGVMRQNLQIAEDQPVDEEENLPRLEENEKKTTSAEEEGEKAEEKKKEDEAAEAAKDEL